MENHDNATWLFIRPSVDFHNAELWWTSLFTIFAFSEVQSKGKFSLPAHAVNEAGELSRAKVIDMSMMTYQNTVVDGRLRKDVFGLSEWPNQFLDLKPDITIIPSKNERTVLFIEVKTVGTSVKRNALLYQALRDYMRGLGWSAELIYLMSKGHEEPSDWAVLRNTDALVFTWEDVFLQAQGTTFENLLGEPLHSYVR